MTYAEKLRDPRWQRRRREILARANSRCEECDIEDVILHVHHKCYRRAAEPWEYEDNELIALCEGCHADRHEIDQIIREVIGHADLNDVTRVHLALLVLGYCASSSPSSEDRCVDLARRISEYAEDSSWFICGFTAGKGRPRMNDPQSVGASVLAHWLEEALERSAS